MIGSYVAFIAIAGLTLLGIDSLPLLMLALAARFELFDVRLIEQMDWLVSWPAIAAARRQTQARIDSGVQTIVGVNKFRLENEAPIDILEIDNTAVRLSQIKRIEQTRRQRDPKRVSETLARLTEVAKTGQGNILEAAVDAARKSRGVETPEVQPAVVEQRPDARVPGQDGCDGLSGGLDHHGQPQGIMHRPCTVMHRLPRQTGAQAAAIAFDHTDPADHIVDQLVAAAEHFGRNARPVILQGNPACDHDRRGDDEFERAEACIGLPVIGVQERPPAKVAARRGTARRRDEGSASGKAPFGADLGPVLRPGNEAQPELGTGFLHAGLEFIHLAFHILCSPCYRDNKSENKTDHEKDQ